MARALLRWPHPVLKSPAAPVEAITDEVREIWTEMIGVMDAMPASVWPRRNLA